MSPSWPDHLLTVEEWEELEEEPGVRMELAEGVLMMSPTPLLGHRLAVLHLAAGLDRDLPPELMVLSEVEVLIGGDPPTIRVPDIVVFATSAYGPRAPRLAAADVRLAIEVSDGTRRIDRLQKFPERSCERAVSTEYAEAGIPQYWIVDIGEPTTLAAYVLVDGAYEMSAEVSGRAELTVAGVPVTIDLDSLTRR